MRYRFFIGASLGLMAAMAATGAAFCGQKPLASAEAPFVAENAAAMEKMMAGMDVKPTGDVDADFAAMMIPHHQGAIDMALAVLRHGKNEKIRRISQEIVVEQLEIVAMRLALGEPSPPSAPAPTAPAARVHDYSPMSQAAEPISPATNEESKR